MRQLVPCTVCARHVDAAASSCPFCLRPVGHSTRAIRLVGAVTRAAVFTGVAACWTGHAPGTAPVETHEAASRVGVVRGTLTLPDGTPARLVTVQLAKLDGSSPVQHVQSGVDGTYQFTNVSPGRYQIVVDWRARRPPSRVVDVGTDPATADFQLERVPPLDPNQIPAPYGAPPARRRVV